MTWNWQLPDWPNFTYEVKIIADMERQFLLQVAPNSLLKNHHPQTYSQFMVDVLSQEGMESAKIEGELLCRESLQSSIKKHFGLKTHAKEKAKETGMAEALCDVYESFAMPLSHEMLWKWHFLLFKNETNEIELGKYRSHVEPMQIVSHRYGDPKVFFEAPPSERVFGEMQRFIDWFNTKESLTVVLEKAAVAHLYFENIHPFEDGNGRIGRLLIEKVLSQGIGQPILIAVSKILEKRKKEYYAALECCNKTLQVDSWLLFFAEVVLQAEKDAEELLNHLIHKMKLMTMLKGTINERQEKVLLKMFQSGPEGFVGGLSAEKYIAITKASRATATRDLAELVSLQALTKTGELRHTRYWLYRT